ncbi:MAG: hypothetical protein FWH27_14435, partial [Planctomycetaceae bacterium]|nr:hypothetical protein [Planctomycetaceae bacterium]
MSHTTPLILVTVLLTAGWAAELSAQTQRQSTMFLGSRVAMFSSSGGLNAQRGELASKSPLASASGQQDDQMLTLLASSDPA